MKKIVLLAALAIFGVTASNAQAKKSAPAKASAKAAPAKVETPKEEVVSDVRKVVTSVEPKVKKSKNQPVKNQPAKKTVKNK